MQQLLGSSSRLRQDGFERTPDFLRSSCDLCMQRLAPLPLLGGSEGVVRPFEPSGRRRVRMALLCRVERRSCGSWLIPISHLVAGCADLAGRMIVQLALAVAQSTAAQLTGRLPCRVAPWLQTRRDERSTCIIRCTASQRIQPCECERCLVVSCDRAAVRELTWGCSGGDALQRIVRSRRRGFSEDGQLPHSLHSSLLAVCFHAGGAGGGALLLSAAGARWRNERAGPGKRRLALCRLHALNQANKKQHSSTHYNTSNVYHFLWETVRGTKESW